MPLPSGQSGPASPAVLTLPALGFTDREAALISSIPIDVEPARVTRDDRGAVIAAGDGFQRRFDLPHDVAAVAGDWLAVADDRIVAVLERSSAIVRPRPDGNPQVLAANVDLVGVVHGLDGPLNRRRLERGLVLAWESGAMPVIILTKADLAEDVEAARATAAASGPGVDVIVASTVDGRGLEDLTAVLQPNRTLALLGASGAGKSSLVNALLGSDELATREVRAADGRGRHTTTHRQLIVLPGGGVLVDTPGLRALLLGPTEQGVALTFSDLGEYAEACRFSDCTHLHEPGCGVLAAVERGDLSADRYEGWRRVQREADNAALRADPAAFRAKARSWGRMGREALRVKDAGDRRRRD